MTEKQKIEVERMRRNGIAYSVLKRRTYAFSAAKLSCSARRSRGVSSAAHNAKLIGGKHIPIM